MESKSPYNINISLPNLINICVDEIYEGEIRGRMYHCYDREPVIFSSAVELLMRAEELFDAIRFPQASTRTRQFQEKEAIVNPVRPVKVVDQRKIILHTGELASFVTGVRFRQGSTWQGDFTRMETGRQCHFSNTLNFLKLLDDYMREEGTVWTVPFCDKIIRIH